MMDWPTIEMPEFEDTIPQKPLWMDTDFKDVHADPSKLREDQPAMEVLSRTYPRIHTQIILLWGQEELQHRFTRWLLTDQEGRRGWSKEVNTALFTLSNLHAEVFGFDVNPIWGGKPDRW